MEFTSGCSTPQSSCPDKYVIHPVMVSSGKHKGQLKAVSNQNKCAESPDVTVAKEPDDVTLTKCLAIRSTRVEDGSTGSTEKDAVPHITWHDERGDTEDTADTADGEEDTPPGFFSCIEMQHDLVRNIQAVYRSAQHWKGSRKALDLHAHTFPEHTLLVRWRQAHNLPCYTPQLVHAILSRYGPISVMGAVGNNLLLVVLESPTGALKLARCGSVGPGGTNTLLCDWLHPHMTNIEQQLAVERRAKAGLEKDFSRSKRSSVDSVYFRGVQEVVQARLDHFTKHMSYNTTDFVP